MLFHSTVKKELAQRFGATLVILVTIVVTIVLIKTLGQASRGSINPSEVMQIMAYTLVGYMPTLLALTLFMAFVGLLNRLQKESEYVIWMSCGRGLTAYIPPFLSFSWPVLIVIAALSLMGLPWSNQQIDLLKDRFAKRSDIQRIAPGQFRESANGKRIFFIDKDTATSDVGTQVFIVSKNDGKETLTFARTGQIESQFQQKNLILRDGEQVEFNFTNNRIRVTEFEEMSTLISEQSTSPGDLLNVKSLWPWQLLAQPSAVNHAELFQRLSAVFSALKMSGKIFLKIKGL